jgi:guanine deaminase
VKLGHSAAQYFQIGTKTNYTLVCYHFDLGSISYILILGQFEWLEKATFPNEAKCSDVQYAKALYTRLVKRLLRNGTTTVQYFATNHLEATKELARICGTLGQRALVGKVCADQLSPDYYVETTDASLRYLNTSCLLIQPS